MDQKKTEELYREMNAFLSEDASAPETGTSDPDDDGLPFESPDAFSTDPVEFGEMAERMLRKVGNIFDLTALYNRHSAKYLKACAMLERGIKYLGSTCLTKIAMEHHNYSFPELGQLTTMKLYRMASFNYRKLDTALTEKLEQGNDLYPELLDMEFRYFNLLRRLRSTEKKIHSYHMKKYYAEENFEPVVEGNAFSPKSWTKKYTQDREEAPVFRQAPAFPLLVKAETAKKKQESKNDISGRKSAADSRDPMPETGDQGRCGAGIEAPEAKEESVPVLSLPAPATAAVPAFAAILENVMKRSADNKDGALSFTYDEIRQLSADPEFGQYDPDMAEYIRQIRDRIPDST